jgi:nitrite reductase (NADH) large subunit
MKQYVIIGNGVAANSAAEAIRARDPQGAVHMFTREEHFFYYIPALPEFLAGEKDENGITLHGARWYADNGITLHRGSDVTSIDPGARTVTTASGTACRYDALLLATGGYSFVPPIPGARSDGVYALRTLADAQRIRRAAAGARRLVLIGGGLLGLEAGNGLRKAGLQVTVVEFFPRLLPRQMDTDGAAMLQKQMEGMGFAFRLGAKTKEITRGDGGLAVHLESGESIPADMVLVSAGVRPEVSLAQALGLAIDKGVKVDDALRTTLPDIYAAGDLIEHRGQFYGIWPAAMDQGRIAGTNMAGGSATYGGTVPANTLKVVGIDLTAAGDIDADGTLESIVLSDAARPVYRKFVLRDNRLVGTILFGDISGAEQILKAIARKTDMAGHVQSLRDPGFDFSRLG